MNNELLKNTTLQKNASTVSVGIRLQIKRKCDLTHKPNIKFGCTIKQYTLIQSLSVPFCTRVRVKPSITC